MFKIVETIENGEKQFSVVPYNWEVNSVLYWPKHLKDIEVNKLLRTSTSVPADNWCTMSCVVKAIADTYLEGRNTEKLFASFTDTEAEEIFRKQSCVSEKRPRKCKLRKCPETDYFNETIENMISVKAGKSCEEDQIPTDVFYEIEADMPVICSQVEGFDNNPLSAPQTTNFDISMELKDFMKHVTTELSGINTKLDRVLKHIGEKHENSNDFQIILTKEVVFPLDSIEDLKLLNTSLYSQEFGKEMTSRLSTIGGNTKVSDGCKIMYKVIDHMFTAEVLNRYSWTGSSKSTEKKECFQKLSNIVDLIFDVIYSADCRHSRQRNEEFLKDKILKHTRQRLQRKRKNQNGMNDISE